MQETRLFETILGIQTPWAIGRVTSGTSGERVDLWAEHEETHWPCRDCQQQLPCRDHAEKRVWRHLDTCQYHDLPLRLEIARERNVPPYVIFHDTTLRELARLKPRSEAELRAIYGVGERKAADLGSRFLAAIAAHAAASA